MRCKDRGGSQGSFVGGDAGEELGDGGGEGVVVVAGDHVAGAGDVDGFGEEPNAAIAKSGRSFTRQVDQLPPQAVLDEIAQKVNIAKLEAFLMDEGLKKFADPQKALLKLIGEKRKALLAK